MNLEIFVAYLATVAVLVLVPGPVVALVVALGSGKGARPAVAATAGASLSIALQLTAAALGLASLLAVLGEAFEVLRWVCAAYLVVLAARLWWAPDATAAGGPEPRWRTASFVQGFLVSSTNPKSLVFFAAFFPQFIDPAGDVTLQLLILAVTFQIVFTAGVAGYGLAAVRLGRLTARPSLARFRNRVLAVMLGGVAVGLATLRR